MGEDHKLNSLFFILIIFFISSAYTTYSLDCADSDVLCVDNDSGQYQEYSTIQSAIGNASGGGIILIFNGTYKENIDWPSGVDNVLVRPADSDFIRLEPNSNDSSTVRISGDIQNVTFDGLLRGNDSQFWIVGASNAPSNDGQIFRMVRSSLPALNMIYFRNLKLQGTASLRPIINVQPASSGYADDIRMENSYIFGNYSRAFEGQGQNFGNGTQNWRARIINNTIDITNADYSGPEASDWDYVLVDKNYIYNNGTSVNYFIQIRKDQNWRVQNNIFEQYPNGDCDAFIILRGNWGGGAAPNYSSNNLIINNDFINLGSTPNYAAIFLTDNSSNNIFQNNFFIGVFAKHLDNATGFNGSGNFFDYNRKTNMTGSGDSGENWFLGGATDGGNNVGGEASFNKTGNKPHPYWDIAQSYDGIDTNFPPNYDYNNEMRGSMPDVGAFEFVASLSSECEPQNVLCVDNDTGEYQEYSTIQSAINDSTAGDTILIFEGAYFENMKINESGAGNYLSADADNYANLVLTKSGNITHPITIKSDGTVIILGNSSISYNIYSISKKYWVIDGLTMKNALNTSIYFMGSNSPTGLTVKNSNFTGNNSLTIKSGIRAIGNNTNITNNTFNVPKAEFSIDLGVGETYNSIISGNTITTDDYAIYLHSDTNNSIIEKNTIIGRNSTTTAIFFRDSPNVTIKYNLIYGNFTNYGILFQDLGYVAGGCKIISNTIDGSDGMSRCINAQNTYANITNNIFYGCFVAIQSLHSTLIPIGQPGYNLFYGGTYKYYNGSNEIYPLGTGNIVGDPSFINITQRNYSLQPSSPAINTADPQTPNATDITNTAVPQGQRADIGAYEYISPLSAICQNTSILCVDNDSGQYQEYSTIQSAVYNASKGDTVLVYPGDYHEKNSYTFSGTKYSVVVVNVSGNSSANFTIIANNPGTVILDGQNNASVHNCFWGRDLDYVIIDGFNCTGVNVEASNVAIGAIHFWLSDNMTLQNNNIYDVNASDSENKPGIAVFGSDSIIRNNYIKINSVGLAGGMSGYLFERNIYENNTIDGNGNASGIYFSQNANDYIIRNNYIHNYGLAGIQVRDSYRAKIYNNIIYQGHGTSGNSWISYAFNIRDWADTGPGIGNDEYDLHQIYNNLIDSASYGFALTQQNDTIIKNNILINIDYAYLDTRWCGSVCAKPSQGLLLDHNIYYNYSSEIYDDFFTCFNPCNATNFTDGGHNLNNTNPQFNSTGARTKTYYQLISNSPAIDAGINLSNEFATDFDGITRPQGIAWDIGAYESNYTAPICEPNTYYVDYENGNDSNAGNCTTSAWKHAPGMIGCSGNCLAKKIAGVKPGDNIILKGGITWRNEALGWLVNFNGNSTNSSPGCDGGGCIYIGVDKRWYNGSSWSRPILNAEGKKTANDSGGVENYLMRLYANFIIVDNIEFTGLYWNNTGIDYGESVNIHIAAGSPGRGANITLKNLYIHGWSHGSYDNGTTQHSCAIIGDTAVPNNNVNTLLQDSVIDGSDTDRESCTGVFGSPPYIMRNLFRYMTNGIIANGPIKIDGNTITDIGYCFDPTAHTNAIEINAAQNHIISNNLIANLNPGTGTQSIWSAVDPGYTAAIFNNLIYNIDTTQTVAVTRSVIHGGCEPEGPTYCKYAGVGVFYGNTIQSGPDNNPNAPCITINPAVTSATIINNHCITNAVSPNNGLWKYSSTNLTPQVTTSNNLVQSKAIANAQGYYMNQTYPFSPINNGAGTIDAGADLSIICTNFSSLCNSSGIGVNYDNITHTVTYPHLNLTIRPQGSAWDIGAYEFVSSSNCSEADVNGDGSISDSEIQDYTNLWMLSINDVTLNELMVAMREWKNGC